jgi:hypothetical protein
MATPKWRPGRLYPPGSLVVPRTAVVPGATALTNPGFESGSAGWGAIGGGAAPAGFSFLSGANAFAGTGYLEWGGAPTAGEYVWNDAVLSVGPGTTVSASAYFHAVNAGDQIGGHVAIAWFNASNAQIGFQTGNEVGLGGWKQSSFSLSAPAGAVTARIGVGCYNLQGGEVRVDSVSLSYVPYTNAALQYKAVQPAAGLSDSTEPTWPQTLGVQVVDNEVIWEAVSVSRVVWEARPIMVTGATEPTWPTSPGAMVSDGTVVWEAISRRVEDENCPNSKAVVILSSKVFAADMDIVRFSATANPRDWTTERDAGYLPTGLQQANSNDMAVLNQYRSNLVAFNANCFQNWQVDPDPEQMAILDQMDGVGSVWQQAAQPVGNELFYLSQLGVRTIGIANAAENLAAGDVGMPVDPLIQAALIAAIESGVEPVATYYPGQGQYWIAFPGEDETETFVYSMTSAGKVGAWSRYVFPFSVEAFAQLGNDLYVRHGDVISRIDEDAVSDEVAGEPVDFPGSVWWPWLDFGQPGLTKMLDGFDYVGTGQGPSISIGYDQRNPAVFTDPYQLENDTMPGGLIPLPVSAPTMSVKLDFAGGAKWRVQSILLSLRNLRGGP